MQSFFGIVGHLDVVPVGDGWTYSPFDPVISDGKLYGRGTTDDKGPVIASLYAMKAVMDNCKVNKRVRLIVGLNEERDWKCINYYKQKEEMPTFGFSPDADFPCIYAEKGLMSVYISSNIENYKNEKITIEDIDCKNNAINVVPKYCKVILKCNDKSISIENIKNDIEKIANESGKEKLEEENNNSKIVVKLIENERKLQIESFGKASHAAHPELGENAISKVIVLLDELFKKYDVNNKFIEVISEKFKAETDGKSLGINVKDDMGALTLNVARFYIENGEIVLGSNLRIPVTYKINDIELKIKNALEEYDFDLVFTDKKDSLYIPKDNELVQKLCRIYNDYYGKHDEPIAIGGATYARAFKNCVSFGASNPNEEDMCHKADEYIKVSNLMDACQIYAKAIYELTR